MMARSHRMTPARRAALRKAQLASARKRRKRGVGSAVNRSVRQGASRTRASAALTVNNKQKRRKAIRRVSAGVAVATVLGASVAYHGSNRAYTNRGVRKSVRKNLGSRRKTIRTKAQRQQYATRVRPLIAHNATRRGRKRHF